MVVLKSDARGGGIVVMFKDAAFDAVIVDVISFDQDIARRKRVARGDEESVAAIVNAAVTDDCVFSLFDIDGRGVGCIILRCSVCRRERVRRPGAANIKVLEE